MADLLYNQKEILRLLKKRGVATFKKASFSEAVAIGTIPHRMIAGFKTKQYEYYEVAEAIVKAGIGKPVVPDDVVDIQSKIDVLPEPKPDETPEEYGESAVKALGKNATITDANIYKTIYQGKLEKMKYEKEKGTLILREEVEDKAFSVARSLRDKILSIPERMASELSSISEPHEIKELLYKEFGVMLDGFSKDSFI